ncbi:MAG: hypothetical protein JWO30_843 [Fibrobacteres bacterium]|nr:hypothetical protein [Fibrobacterota bacterium]
MTREELVEQFDQIEDQIISIRRRWEVPMIAPQRHKLKADFYANLVQAERILRSESDETYWITEFDNVKVWMNSATQQQWFNSGEFYLDKIAGLTNNIVTKGRVEGLKPKAERPATDPTLGIRMQLEERDVELATANKRIQDLEERPPTLPSKDMITPYYAVKHFPWWLLAVLISGLLADLKVVYDAYAWIRHVNEPVALPSLRPTNSNPNEVHWER